MIYGIIIIFDVNVIIFSTLYRNSARTYCRSLQPGTATIVEITDPTCMLVRLQDGPKGLFECHTNTEYHVGDQVPVVYGICRDVCRVEFDATPFHSEAVIGNIICVLGWMILLFTCLFIVVHQLFA